MAILGLSQAYISYTTGETESYSYEVVSSYPEFEIRQYESANFAYVDLKQSSYQASSGSGFRVLANYIFGGNEANQQIAMTSPVVMEMDKGVRMKFMVPANYKLEDLPTPNSERVQFETEPGKLVAAIRFSGWANDDKIDFYTTKLKELLKANNIRSTGEFSYFGYNPPYEVVNRRNEVVVEVEPESLP